MRTPPDSDYIAGLIDRYQAGDAEAGELLIAANRGAIVRLVKRYRTGAAFDHDDLEQECRLILLASAATYRQGVGEWVGYLSTNVNRHLSRLVYVALGREMKREPWNGSGDYGEWISGLEAIDPYGSPKHALCIDELMALVDRLPAGPRTAYVLRHGLDTDRPGHAARTLDEVAALMRTGHDRVTTALSVAVEMMRGFLCDD